MEVILTYCRQKHSNKKLHSRTNISLVDQKCLGPVHKATRELSTMGVQQNVKASTESRILNAREWPRDIDLLKCD